MHTHAQTRIHISGNKYQLKWRAKKLNSGPFIATTVL